MIRSILRDGSKGFLWRVLEITLILGEETRGRLHVVYKRSDKKTHPVLHIGGYWLHSWSLRSATIMLNHIIMVCKIDLQSD